MNTLIRPSYCEWLARRAARNLEKWGVQDFETLGLAIAEECGELCQAILQAKHEGGERNRIVREAIDLGALCLQVMVTMSQRHGLSNLTKAIGNPSLTEHYPDCPARDSVIPPGLCPHCYSRSLRTRRTIP